MLQKTNRIWLPVFDHLIGRGWAQPASLRPITIAPHCVVEIVVGKRKPTRARWKSPRKKVSASSEKMPSQPRAGTCNPSTPSQVVGESRWSQKDLRQRRVTARRDIKKDVSNLSPLGPGLERCEHAPGTPPPSWRARVRPKCQEVDEG